MPYIIKCWIPVEAEKPDVYESEAMAEEECAQLQGMQPENRYETYCVNKRSTIKGV